MKKKPLPKIVDISIDFDFFIREKFSWDWGHGEGKTYSWDIVHWNIRYATELIHLFKATDIPTYADFIPTGINLFPQFLNRKLILVPQKLGEFGYSDSHKNAFPFLLKKGNRTVAERTPPDLLVNIDAHHDCYDNAELNCGNWLLKIMEEWQGGKTKFVQCYPQWAQREDTRPDRLVTILWKDWMGPEEPHRVRHIYLCRSGGWVPPHHDPMFIGFLRDLAYMFPKEKRNEYGELYERPFPSLEEYNKEYPKHFSDIAKVLNLSVEDIVRKSINSHKEDSLDMSLLPNIKLTEE